jgi:hypothetical protein
MLDKVRALSKIKPRLDKAGVEVIQVQICLAECISEIQVPHKNRQLTAHYY